MTIQMIEETIQNTFLETQRIVFKEESHGVIVEGSDEYLDLINEFKVSLASLTPKLIDVNDALEKAMTHCSDELLLAQVDLLRPLIKSAKQVIDSLTKSIFYPGIGTYLTAYEDEANCLEELLQDIELRTKIIKEDDDFQSLISQINCL